MKRCGKIVACIAAGLALDAVSRAGDIAPTDNPYAMIATRNIFGLNPPPIVDPNPPVAEPAVKIMPNGIMSVMGQAQALFKTTGSGKPGEQSYMLAEGQSDDEIEVIKIDEKARTVTFNNHGTVQEIPLASTTAGSAATATAQPATASAGFQPASTAQGGVSPAANGFAPSVIGGASVNNAGGSNPGIGQSGVNNPYNGSNLKFGPTTYNYTAPQPQNAIDPDVQKVLIVANHLKAQQDGDSVAKIYPPTELDDAAGVTPNIVPTSTTDGSSSQ